MRQFHLSVIALLARLVVFAPAFAETIPFPASVGEPYTGRMTIEAFPVDGGHRIHRAHGDAEVRFSTSNEGGILFSTTAALDDGGSVDLSVTLGPQEDGAWRSMSEAGPTEITAEGRILSLTELDGFHMVMIGEIGPEAGKLTLRRFPTENAGTAPDAEMMTVFLFDVSQPSPATASEPRQDETSPRDKASSATESSGGCERIEWRLVNRWNWGGGMSLSPEPHCVPKRPGDD